jgi:hypothetical protein
MADAVMPADICRCHDDSCDERHDCLRWLQRDSGSVHAISLNPYAVDSDDRCELKVVP